MQRLSEELERQGEVVNHHAALIRERESDLEAALDRANRAHEELIALEPPSLAQAVGSLEILLRVSTESVLPKEGGDVTVEAEGKRGDGGMDVIGDRESQNSVWCLVRYLKKRSSSKGGVSSRGYEASIGSVDKGEDDEAGKGRNADESAPEGEGDDDKEKNREDGGGEGGDAPESASSLAETVGGDDGQGGGEQGHPVGKVNVVDMKEEEVVDEKGENSGGNMAAAVEIVEGGEESEDMSPPIPSSVDVAGESTFLVVVEWRTQEEVDEWFASRLAAAIEMEQEHELEHRGSEGAEGETSAAESDARAPASTMPSALPMLDTPVTIQEAFAAKIAGVKAELNSELEKARAELSRNTEAYKQYRARVRETGDVRRGGVWCASVSRCYRGEASLEVENLMRVSMGRKFEIVRDIVGSGSYYVFTLTHSPVCMSTFFSCVDTLNRRTPPLKRVGHRSARRRLGSTRLTEIWRQSES